ncbi:MAG: hypothetical protein ACJAYN_001422 [Bermanella sp.]|jgi:hypothetical protein|uniref:hypothetical protein n=1 Tax=Glaciecola sp. 33A TaxID=2057807 RepID=UPI000C31E6A6|nr:hypothetical protein [Glaciecola sp. 33A]PKI02126.1 hypothetical protein CXF81_07280 [Glaciecola sp. 33A]
MREVIKMESDLSFGNADNGLSQADAYLYPGIVPFFSIRKLRVIYNELSDTSNFEYHSFDAFKHQVMSSAAPHLELNKWQAIASRR